MLGSKIRNSAVERKRRAPSLIFPAILMSKRLASFGGPSTPSSAPVSGQTTSYNPGKKGGKNKAKARDVTPSSLHPGPTSPRSKADASRNPSLGSRASSHAPHTAATTPKKSRSSLESPVRYLIRSILRHTASELDEWESIASRRALKCAKLIVDTTTELENALNVASPPGSQPTSRILGSRLKELNRARVELQGYRADLAVTFSLLATRVSELETALSEYTQTISVEESRLDPIWDDRTWTFEHFVSHIARVLRPINRSNHIIATLAGQIISYSLSTGGLDSPTNTTEAHHTLTSTSNDINNQTDFNQPNPSTQRGAVPTFSEARSALAAWSAEVSRVGEFIREWNETCEIEVAGWDEDFNDQFDDSGD